MNAYILLSVFIVIIVVVLGSAATLSTTALILILLMGSGAAMALIIVLVWEVKLKSTMYPVRLRSYADRYDAFTVDKDTSARVVKGKDGYEYLELINGKRFKMPDRKHIVKGNNSYVDIYDAKSMAFPIEIKREDGTPLKIHNKEQLIDAFAGKYPVTIRRDNIKDVWKRIIPENHRVWFADQAIPSIKASTEPPINKWMQILPIATVMLVLVLIVVSVLFIPIFWEKTQEHWNVQIDDQIDRQNEFFEVVGKSPLVCNCNCDSDPDIKPEPPPS